MSTMDNDSLFTGTVYLGADHGGFELKQQIKQWLTEWGVSFQDLGSAQLQPDDDYPDYALAVAEHVAQSSTEAVGVLVCRSGGGMTIAANKVKGIRAVPVYEPEQAVHAKTDDHANIISLAGDWTLPDQAKSTLRAFLETAPNQDERHLRRIRKIEAYEQKNI